MILDLPFRAGRKSAVVPTTATLTPSIPIGNIGAPRIPIGTSYSLNWAGYVDLSSTGGVTAVYGSWIVPTLSCKGGTSYVALWAGIDGYNDNTVEHGILAQCSHGSVQYYAWYEFYPAAPVYAPSSDIVKPGDVIYASIVYNGGTFATTLQDKTEGWTFTSPSTPVSGAERNSAEWIVERPALCNGIKCTLSNLADFGKAYFGEDYTSVAFTNYATINGATEPIGYFTYTSITMVSGPQGTVLASPSTLSSDGTSFTVTYGS